MRKQSHSHRAYERTIRLVSVIMVVLTAVTIGGGQSTPSESSQRARIVKPRRVFVRSTSLLVRAAVVEDKLLKTSEFKQMGFVLLATRKTQIWCLNCDTIC